MDMLTLFLENLWSTTVALSLWLLIGLLIAGVLHVWVPDNFVKHHLGHRKGLLTVFKAVIFGVPLPLCSCGVIPAALGIKKQGAGDGAAIGFLISTPQTGIDSIMVSASMLGWPFAIFKLASAFVIGIVGGIWTYFSNSTNGDGIIEDDNSSQSEKRGIKDLFPFAIDDLMKMIWKWLVAGIIVSAAITTWMPQDFFQTYLPNNIFIAMLIVLVISLPMYVCATASVPIAAALVYTGMPAGAAMVFLMAGPASNVATIGAVYRAFGLKKLLIYLTSIIVGSMLGGYLFNSVITPSMSKPEMTHHGDAGLISIIAAIIFIILILRFLIIEIKNHLKGKKQCCCAEESESKTIIVSGMTCEGCAGKLRKALMNIAEVADVKIELESGEVKITGSNLNYELISKTVIKIGYQIPTP
jgi:uncharacterized protein